MAGEPAAVLPGGVLVALATPIDDRGGLDEPGLDRLIRRVVDAGVVGICPAGSTGEGARLTRPQRRQLVSAVRARIPDGMPVIAGLPVTTLDDARLELVEAGAAGASAALVAAPSYYPASDDDLRRLYTELADAAPVPIVLYNIPVYTSIPIPPEIVAELAGHPNVAGIKDSSRDMEYLEDVVYRTRDQDFRVLTGSDTLLFASLLVGVHATIAASANLVPALGVGIYDAVARGDHDGAKDLQRKLFNVVQACRRGSAPAGWKAALQIEGVCSARMVSPASRLCDELWADLESDLARLL